MTRAVGEDKSQQDAQETIAAISRLLHHACAQTSRQARAEGPQSALHVHTLTIHIAAAQVALLVPPHLDPYWPGPAQGDAPELLRAARRLSRAVPLNDTTQDLASLVSSLVGLLDEAMS